MIHRIRVWELSTGTYCLVGEMVCEIAGNSPGKGAFRYEREYLERGDAFSMDPVSLPLKPDTFPVEHPGVFSVFEDSLPDDWGRKLLVRKHEIPRHEQNLPTLLLALGSSGLGALSYTRHDMPQPPSPDISILKLSSLVMAAEMFEQGRIVESEFSLLLGAGSSPGGARPKSVVYDEENDIHYLAKFPSIKDQVDVVTTEYATMLLAAKAGLEVPPTRLTSCSERTVLLVQRFDIIPHGRRHMISLQTLLKAHGYYQLRYQDVLEIVRKYSGNPQKDSERFYRHMVFNALVGNTDDHLKNFWMVFDHEQKWRLSPSFDLIPDIGNRGEHVLFFDVGPYYNGRKNIEKLGRRWGIPNADALVSHVFEAVSGWKELFSRVGVSEADIHYFREIDAHLRME